MSSSQERLSTEIDKEILREFKQIVIRKHGKLRGNMPIEVTEALKLYINNFKKKG